MDPRLKAFLVGAGASVPLLGVLLYFKVGNLTDKATVIQASLTAQATSLVEAEAKATVDQYLADVYGVTPQRIEKIGQLASRVEPLTRLF